MQSKWVIGAAVSTLSIGVIGVSAAFAASSAHLSDQSGVTISAGIQGESITPIANPIDAMQRAGSPGTSESKDQADPKNQADDKTSQHNTNNQQTQHQQKPPVQTQAPQPEAPVVAPPPQPQSVSSISVESFD